MPAACPPKQTLGDCEGGPVDRRHVMGRTAQEMEEILQQIQAGVARIERDHGARFDALGLLRPIASDHESRIQALESVSKK